MAKVTICALFLVLSVSSAWSGKCTNKGGTQTCLNKADLTWQKQYFGGSDGPCFDYNGKQSCFVSAKMINRCACTEACGCVAGSNGCDNKAVPSSFATDCSLGGTNTMCKYKGLGSTCGKKVCTYGLTQDQKQQIVDEHNKLRQRVANGDETLGYKGPQPGASNMNELVWDDELAVVAQRWTDQCTSGHDKNRNSANYKGVGQNAASSGSTADPADEPVDVARYVNMWYNEVKDFDSSTVDKFKSKGHNGVVGHYTQAVWAKTEKVGCGFIQYESGQWFKRSLVCNYYPQGNFLGAPVYEVGKSGSSCANGDADNDGLCDAA